MTQAADGSLVQIRFEASVIYWRGPSPFFFAPIPPEHGERLRRIARVVTYGWGMIPVEATIADVSFRTSLFPKDETYLLPIKADIRRKVEITAGDLICVGMTIEAVER